MCLRRQQIIFRTNKQIKQVQLIQNKYFQHRGLDSQISKSCIFREAVSRDCNEIFFMFLYYYWIPFWCWSVLLCWSVFWCKVSHNLYEMIAITIEPHTCISKTRYIPLDSLLLEETWTNDITRKMRVIDIALSLIVQTCAFCARSMGSLIYIYIYIYIYEILFLPTELELAPWNGFIYVTRAINTHKWH